MRLRRLDPSEHGKTRALYEAVFPEDDAAFVDYYYQWKTADNRIYVAEDAQGVHAMVHLNPFQVYLCGKVERCHYIVAVATQQEYRHQRLMRRLLELAEREMEADGEAFTFLMPASEKIYAPLGYRYFCSQAQGSLCTPQQILSDAAALSAPQQILSDAAALSAPQQILSDAAVLSAPQRILAEDADFTAASVPAQIGAGDADSAACIRPVRAQEYRLLADFVNETLRAQYDVFVWRDAAYYERLCAEQQCQGGNVMVLVQEGALIGTFCTAMEQRPDALVTELRELVINPGKRDAAEAALRKFAEAHLQMPQSTVIQTGSAATQSTAIQTGSAAAQSTVIQTGSAAAQSTAIQTGSAAAQSTAIQTCSTAQLRIAGCNLPLAIADAAQKPLLMAKTPGGGVYEQQWSAERIFLNEVV